MAPVAAGDAFTRRPAPRDRQGDPRRRDAVPLSSSRSTSAASEGETRPFAERLHAALVAPDRSVLVLVDPAAKLLEIVTGAEAHRVARRRRGRARRADHAERVRGRRPGRRHHPRRAAARRARPPPAAPARLTARRPSTTKGRTPRVRPFVVPVPGQASACLARRARARCRRGASRDVALRGRVRRRRRQPRVDPVEGLLAGQRPREHVLQHRRGDLGALVLPDRVRRRRGSCSRYGASTLVLLGARRRRRRCCAGSRWSTSSRTPRPARPAPWPRRSGSTASAAAARSWPGDGVVAGELLERPGPVGAAARGQRGEQRPAQVGVDARSPRARTLPSSRPASRSSALVAARGAAVRRRRDRACRRCRRTPCTKRQLVVAAGLGVLEQPAQPRSPRSPAARRAWPGARTGRWRSARRPAAA